MYQKTKNKNIHSHETKTLFLVIVTFLLYLFLSFNSVTNIAFNIGITKLLAIYFLYCTQFPFLFRLSLKQACRLYELE